MKLENRFTVPVPRAEAWRVLLDVERVAPCMPGATLTSRDGDNFTGTVKVKVGPINLTYGGQARFVSVDEAGGVAVIEGSGKETRGTGTAKALITCRLIDKGQSTDVEVETDLAVTGKPAQFGRGVMQDVSDKLLQQFVTCLKDKVGSGEEEPVAASSPEPTGSSQPSGEEVTQLASSSPGAADTSDAPTGTPVGEESAGDVSGARKTPSTAYAGASAGGSPTPSAPRSAATGSAGYSGSSGSDDALDLGATVLPVLARTYGKQVAAGLALLLLGWLLGRRGR